METIRIENNIIIFYTTAESFPAGVSDAHNNLHALVPFSRRRKYFGISRPENNGEIIYRAGTEETRPNEGNEYNCDTLILKKGDYISVTVPDFRDDPQSIGKAFQMLLTHPNLDPQGYCVEWYMNDREEVKCMIRLNQ